MKDVKGVCNMKKKFICFVVLFFVFLFFVCHVYAGKSDEQKYNAVYGAGDQAITVATGSPGALGLLKALAEPFCQANKCRINWIKKGSGASLKAMKAGKVDLVMVHAPAAEKKAVKATANVATGEMFCVCLILTCGLRCSLRLG